MFKRKNVVLIFELLIIAAMLFLAGMIFFQEINFTSLDLGRHIKNGEVIWENRDVLYKNLYSFTEPEAPFVNHHWLSGVIYFFIYKIGGFAWLNIFNILLALLSVLLAWLLAKKNSNIFIAAILGLPVILIMSERTDIRPEMFSYFFIVLYLWLFSVWRRNGGKDISNRNLLILILALQLIWANLHIYFFVGLMLTSLFFGLPFALKFIREKIGGTGIMGWKDFFILNRERFILFIGVWVLSLLNPHYIRGLAFPFTIFKAYGYEIAENKSPFYMEKLMDSPNILIFKIMLIALVVSFFIKIKFDYKNKEEMFSEKLAFNFLISVFFIVLAVFAVRNLPVFSLAVWPVMAYNFVPLSRLEWVRKKRIIPNAILAGMIVIAVYASAIAYVLADGKNNAKIVRNPFGLGLTKGSEDSIKFFRENNLAGPIFNNYDLGSALEFWLYPKEKVFVDNRPEAYSVDFFQTIYKPMQNDGKEWKRLSAQYGISLIYFSHTDATPWANKFLAERLRDSEWPLIYLDNYTVIFARTGEKNKSLIEAYALDEKKFEKRINEIYAHSDLKDALRLASLSELYGKTDLAEKIYLAELKKRPENPRLLTGLGGLYAGRPKREDQLKAIDYLNRALDQGSKLPAYYNQLGLCYWNLEEYAEAKKMWEKALKIDKENEHARYYLNQANSLIK